MAGEGLREAWLGADASFQALLACNRLLITIAAGFAGIALLLAGAFGYSLGKQHSIDNSATKGNGVRVGVGIRQSFDTPRRAGSITQDPSEAVLQPRLGSTDALRPVPSTYVQDLDSARQASLTDTKENKEGGSASLLPIAEQADHSEQEGSVKDKSEALQAVFSNYISRWQDNAEPWKEPAFGRESRLGSRVASYNSDISMPLTRHSSMDVEWQHPALNYRPSEVSVMGTNVLYTDWEINSSQIKFCYTTKGELVTLGSQDESSQINVYKAVLDGKLDVAVKTLKLSRETIPHQKMTELAQQQLSLNAAQQLVHFYGVSRSDDQIMLVYEFVEGGNMREAIRRNPFALGWYQNGKVIARDIAQGLAYLHRHATEHRSFKSNQVMVRASDNTAKIADAGLQAITRYCQQSRTRRLAASFEWAAPELLLGQRCGPEADIFAFAIVLWELVTQEMPIRGALRDVRTPEECPGPIKTLINRCMAREPDMRPTADEIVGTIQRAWNMTIDGSGRYEEPRSAMRSRQRSLQPSKSQPLDGAERWQEQSRQTRDPVLEMVNMRRDMPVRQADLMSSQSAGGVTSSPSRYHPIPEDRVYSEADGRPPPSPQSSPEVGRRSSSMSPQQRRRSMGSSPDRNRLRPFAARVQAAGTSPTTPRGPNFHRFMSNTASHKSAKDAIDERNRLEFEKKRRAMLLKASHSAPQPGQKKEGEISSDRQRLDASLKKGMEEVFNLNRPSKANIDTPRQSKRIEEPAYMIRPTLRAAFSPPPRAILSASAASSPSTAAQPQRIERQGSVLPPGKPAVRPTNVVQSAGCSNSSSSMTNSLQSSKADQANPFFLARDSLRWDDRGLGAQDATDSGGETRMMSIESQATSTTSLASQANSLISRAESLQDGTVPYDDTSRMERWRQRCDITFTNWLGLDAAASGEEPPRRSLSSRFGSFARLPAFRRHHNVRGSLESAKTAMLRSEEICPSTSRARALTEIRE